ncbi:molybdopterin-dependent oxidoreductase [Streptomyces sp. NPDC003388]|uniref:molybdopterin-dependent oxidoreductase n=1 Tax=unclassified Streptomyces TaxID=2593676 RepID=UPI001175B5D7|nr:MULTISPECIES: molybdopterin-dependent oxidoreductase [unclassified Streptomyces]MDI1459136.1 molybdopterin-dependent oxidoreductase [Streptomyces sp. ATE26]GEJ99405.1 membrane protein [Streptomyces sp. 1-11]
MRDHPRLPTAPGFWRSPLRGPWFTSVLGLVLLAGVTVLFVTGLVSYAAYNPDLSPVNDTTPDKGVLGFYLFPWPTGPVWLYRFTQGVHVTLGVTLVPVLLAKLWSVVPRLFTLPPARSLAHALERLSLLLLVGGGLFEFTTGVLNIQLAYVFPGSFYPLHFYGAWVFFAAFAAHAVLKAPAAVRTVRRRLREQPESDLTAPRPDPPTVSRRGALWLAGGGSLLLFLTTVGQSLGGPLRRTAPLAPHGGPDPGGGPNGFQINKTAAYAGIDPAETGAEAWRLVVTGRTGTVRLSRAELLRLPQHSSSLPIACVEGWSTADQWWRGVRLRDLAALVGHDGAAPDVLVESLQRHGAFRRAALRANQVADGRSLLALSVNGEDLSLDHGSPARVIVPAAPGVLNTKWVARLTFGDL